MTSIRGFTHLGNWGLNCASVMGIWARRDPTPDTPRNEFKDEHYRRIKYANEHFVLFSCCYRLRLKGPKP